MSTSIFVLLSLCSLSFPSVAKAQYGGEQMSPAIAARVSIVPALFIFGDSLIDNGNNNGLPSFAKANYFPYGIDFPAGPTGRFSNGYTIVDEIAELLGLPLIPPNSETRGEVLRGVNYASAASGILDNTGQNFAGRIPFNEQIKNFESTLDMITARLGAEAAAESIAECLFFVGMGSNDYLNNYLMPNYDTRARYDPNQYSDLLSSQYQRQIMRLYNLGARKFMIAGVGMLGCIPSILAQGLDNRCNDDVNNLVIPFNNKVKEIVNNFNADLPKGRFIYIDIYRMFADILMSPLSYGFLVTKKGCCGVGRDRGQITCLPYQNPCIHRNTYLFWDAYHPTAAVSTLLARTAFSDGQLYVSPMNIQQLAFLQL